MWSDCLDWRLLFAVLKNESGICSYFSRKRLAAMRHESGISLRTFMAAITIALDNVGGLPPSSPEYVAS